MANKINYKKGIWRDGQKCVAYSDADLNKLETGVKAACDAADNATSLVPATSTVLGGIKVGDGLAVTTDGTLSANATPYTLPVATENTLGGIKIDAYLFSISNDKLQLNTSNLASDLSNNNNMATKGDIDTAITSALNQIDCATLTVSSNATFNGTTSISYLDCSDVASFTSNGIVIGSTSLSEAQLTSLLALIK